MIYLHGMYIKEKITKAYALFSWLLNFYDYLGLAILLVLHVVYPKEET